MSHATAKATVTKLQLTYSMLTNFVLCMSLVTEQVLTNNKIALVNG